MTQACAACREAAPGESRWKGVALLVGAIAFCPCHLPLTIAALATIGGTAWLVGNAVLLYIAFGVTYILVLYYGFRYLNRSRDAEVERNRLHERHAPAASSAHPA